MRANIPEVLRQADLLKLLCEHFEAYIEKAELDRARLELDSHRKSQEQAEWITRIIEHIRQGIDEGDYEIIPKPSTRSDSEQAVHNASTMCFMELLQFELTERDVIWVDDRFANGYERRDANPIVGINEILKLLVCKRGLDISTYYELLLRLRAANVHYIPVEKEEIIHHLRQAAGQGGVLQETPALRTLRRYVARCVLKSEWLQPPKSKWSANPGGEMAFALSLSRATETALAEIWLDKEAEAPVRWARSDWVYRNLFLGHVGFCRLGALKTRSGDRYHIMGMSLAGLISLGMGLLSMNDKDSSSARSDYLEWLYRMVLRRRFEADAKLLWATSSHLKKMLVEVSREVAEEVSPHAVQLAIQRFYFELPGPIREELQADTDFMAAIGLKSIAVADVGGLHFTKEEFLKAAKAAINGKRAKARTLDSKFRISFSSRAEGITLKHPISKQNFVITNPVLSLLSDSISKREKVLRENRYWFDCAGAEFERIIARLASEPDAGRRIESVETFQSKSMDFYYRSLKERLSSKQSFQFTDLRPCSAEGLLKYLRLEDTRDIPPEEWFNQAAVALIKDEGLAIAIRRMAGLPVKLPESITNAFGGLRSEEKSELLWGLLKEPGTPLSRFHMLRLTVEHGEEIPGSHRILKRLLKRLTESQGVKELEFFSALLLWVENDFASWPELTNWPPAARLTMIWLHTHGLFQVFTSVGGSVEELTRIFQQAERRLSSAALFRHERRYDRGVAHPRQISRETMLLNGLCYAFERTETQNAPIEVGKILTNVATSEEKENGARAPVVSVLKDCTLAGNCLRSFLGGNLGYKLSRLITDEWVNLLSSESLRMSATQAVNKIIEGGDEFWLNLYAIMGNLPAFRELLKPLKSAILASDFVAIFQKDPVLGKAAIQAASWHVQNFASDDVRLHVRKQIIKLAEFIDRGKHLRDVNGPKTTEKSDDLIRSNTVLLSSALDVSTSSESLENRSSDFAALLSEILEVSKSMRTMCFPLIESLLEELPLAEAEEYYPLLVRLRAD